LGKGIFELLRIRHAGLNPCRGWAWLIVNGYKDIENRIGAAKWRGPVLIHASRSKSDTTPKALACIKRRYRITERRTNLKPAASSAPLKSRTASNATVPNGSTAHSAGRSPCPTPALHPLQRPAQVFAPKY
jgi:hypothetical protein